MSETKAAAISRATVGLARLESIKSAHRKDGRACAECEYLWPCDAARLVVAVELAIPMIDALADQCEVYARVEEALA